MFSFSQWAAIFFLSGHCGAISAICRHKSKAFLPLRHSYSMILCIRENISLFPAAAAARGLFVFCSILLYLQCRLEKLWGSFMGFFTLTSVDGPGTIHLSALYPSVSLRSAFYLRKSVKREIIQCRIVSLKGQYNPAAFYFCFLLQQFQIIPKPHFTFRNLKTSTRISSRHL